MRARHLKSQLQTPRTQTPTCLFVDGSNLYSAQYDLYGPDRYLLFPRFIDEVQTVTGYLFTRIYFYASYISRGDIQTPEEVAYSLNENMFYQSAKQDPRVTFFAGYRSPTSGKEKEVDVKITADMVSMALMSEVQSLHLMTGDADFLQCFETITRYRPTYPLGLICIENRILYKGLYVYPSDVIKLTRARLKVAEKARIHHIPKNRASLCVAQI